MNQNSRLTEQGEPGKGRKRSRKPAPVAADAAPRDIVPVTRVENAAKEATKEAGKPAAVEKPSTDAAPLTALDIEQFSRNVARMVEEGGRALAAYLKPRAEGALKTDPTEDVGDAVKTLARVAEYWIGD